MRLSLLLFPGALAACSPGGNDVRSDDEATGVNVDAIDDANDRPAPRPAAPDSPAPGAVPAVPVDVPSSDPPGVDERAEGAARVVQTYYALLGARNYERAWAMWENPDLSIGAFEESFRNYLDYRARVGAPGRIDAGAGQRSVTVPVEVYGRLRDNRPFRMQGSVVLHRTVADGASDAQRRWRIRASDLQPRPDDVRPTPQPSPGPTRAVEDNRGTARYRCMDGSRVSVAYDPDNRRATVSSAGKRVATLAFQPGASGIRYSGNGYDWRGKGESFTWTQPNLPPLACKAIR
ncbi:MliC family protein [Sphingomonas sp. HF-S3]|uniref:MliC family protein n=1 Tax=Sphingomonas rustica TaxID=3103142 RepID=A0ABV0B1T5_9SPHN